MRFEMIDMITQIIYNRQRRGMNKGTGSEGPPDVKRLSEPFI